MKLAVLFLVSLTLVSACGKSSDSERAGSPPKGTPLSREYQIPLPKFPEVAPAAGATKPFAGSAPKVLGIKRIPSGAKEEFKPVIRIVAHPNAPMILYVTDLPGQTDSLSALLGLVAEPHARKLVLVDVKSGEWKEVKLAQQIEQIFGLKDANITFEVGGISRVSVGQ